MNLWPALWLSFRIATAATALVILVGVPLAYFMSRRRFPGTSIVEGIIMMPLVLPPTVVGYYIIMTLGARGVIGHWLKQALDYSIVFRFEGAVLAAAIISLPMLYIPARAAFASTERELEDMARTLGANRAQLFWHVSIPLARKGLISGIMLCFARSIGEFGATIMVYGLQPARMTLPISIYLHFEHGQLADASGAVVILTVVSLGLIMAYNVSSVSRQD